MGVLIRRGRKISRRGKARLKTHPSHSHNTPVFLQLLPPLLLRHLLFLLRGCSLLLRGSPPIPLLPPFSSPLGCAPLLFPQLFSVSPVLYLLPSGGVWPWAALSPLLLASRASAPACHTLCVGGRLPGGSPPRTVTCRGRKKTGPSCEKSDAQEASWSLLAPKASFGASGLG